MSDDFDIPGRIKCGTVTTPDFAASLADYRALGLAIAAEATIAPDLAASWDAPAAAGARTALLIAPTGRPAYIRLIEAPIAALPMRSFGWAAYELTVADCFALHAALPPGFSVLGPPRHVAGFDNFIPFQVSGRAGEVLYLNQILKTGMSGLDLPMATAPIDQIFIAVLAAPDRAAAVAFHRDVLGFDEGPSWTLPIGVINTAFDLPPETAHAITMTRTGRLPACEIDQFPPATTPPPTAPGHLPPGNALVSFIHADLATIAAPFITPPTARAEPPYAGRRVATLHGTAGERIELIEAGEP